MSRTWTPLSRACLVLAVFAIAGLGGLAASANRTGGSITSTIQAGPGESHRVAELFHKGLVDFRISAPPSFNATFAIYSDQQAAVETTSGQGQPLSIEHWTGPATTTVDLPLRTVYLVVLQNTGGETELFQYSEFRHPVFDRDIANYLLTLLAAAVGVGGINLLIGRITSRSLRHEWDL